VKIAAGKRQSSDQNRSTGRIPAGSFRRRGLLFLAAAAVLPSGAALAQNTDNWIAGSGFWSTAGNWNTDVVPGNNDNVNIGISNDATFTTVYDYTGPNVTLNTLSLYAVNSTNSNATFDMFGNTLTANQENVGYSNNGAAGIATFNQTDGTNTFFYLNVGVNGAEGVYDQSGGQLVATGNEFVGATGVGFFNQTGGYNYIPDPNAIYVGYQPGSTGTYTLSGTGFMVAGADLYVGNDSTSMGYFNQTGGTCTVVAVIIANNSGSNGIVELSGGQMTNREGEGIGNSGVGILDQTGGTNTLLNGPFYVGVNGGSNGTYNLSNGLVSISLNELIGYEGTGTFNQTGGINMMGYGVGGPYNMNLGTLAGSSGTYLLSGGSATVSGNVTVGGSDAAPEGPGVLTISGTGSMSISHTLVVYNSNGSSVNMLGGTLSAAIANVGGVVNYTSGLFNIPTVTVTSSGSLNANGSLSLPGSLSLQGGKISAGPTSGAVGTLSSSSLSVSGGTLQIALGLNSNSLAASEELIIGGTASFTGSSTIALNISSGMLFPSGTYTLLAAGTLDAGQPLAGGGTAPGVLPTVVFPNVSGETFAVDYTSQPNDILLDVVSEMASTLAWTGSNTTAWDVQTAANWYNTQTAETSEFANGDSVIFSDAYSGGRDSVSIVPGGVEPSAVSVMTSNTFTFSGGAIDGLSGLSVSGGGTLILENANTYSAATNISGGSELIIASGGVLASAINIASGTLQTQVPTSLGSVTLGDSSNDSGVLDLDGNNLTISNLSTIGNGTGNFVTDSSSTHATLTYAGGNSTFGGVIKDGGGQISLTVQGGSLTLTGVDTFSGNTTIGTASSLTVNNSSSNSPNINVNGTLIDNGSVGVSAGNLTVNSGGILTVAAIGSLNSNLNLVNNGSATLNNAAQTVASLNGSGSLTLSATTLTISDGGIYSGAIGGSGSLTLSGGFLVISGSNSYSGNTTIQGGTLQITNSNALGPQADSKVYITTGGTLDIGGDTSGNDLTLPTKQFFISGNGGGGEGAIVNNGPAGQLFAFGTVTLTGNSAIGGTTRWDFRTGSNTLNLNGATLDKVGTNQISLVSTNVENTSPTTGLIDVQSGLLSLENGTTTTGPGSIMYENGVNAQFYNSFGSITWPMTFVGNNIVGNASPGLATVASEMTLNGSVTLEPLNGLSGGTPGNNYPLALTGNIGGTGSLTVSGATTVTLSGSNSYSGGTNIQLGILQVGAANALPTGTSLGLGDASGDTGTLDLNGLNATVGGLAVVSPGAGVIGNSSTSNNSTLTFAGGATASTFAGQIVNSISSGNKLTALNVSGGTLVVTGSNSFTGGTTVTGGTLVVGASGALPNSAVTVGNGNMTGSIYLASGIGTNMVSSLTINTGSTLDISNNAIVLPDSSDSEATIQQFIESGEIVSGYAASNNLGIAYADGSDVDAADPNLQSGQIVVEPDLLGDTDLNGDVNIHDLQNLLSDFNQPGYWDEGNFNGHATVDISDLQALLTNFNTSVMLSYSELTGIENLVGEFGDIAVPNADGTGFTLVAVPEPASLGGLAIGFSILTARRRLRNSHR
jgi:fibronectin-binding autotransporter adhesin